jgi:PAS domain S-box-containing protein
MDFVDQRLARQGGGLRDSLSPRERQLLILASQGLTDQAIAHKLGISLATVGTYWGRIRIKMGPLNRTELVAVFLREEASETVANLRQENQRLLAELEQQGETTEMLRVTLEILRGLVDTAPDAIVLVGEDGRIQLANEQAEEMFGFGRGELRDVSVEELVPERYRTQHVVNRDDYMENPVKRRMGEHLATMALRKDGTEFPMATALSATRTAHGTFVTCIIRDLSYQLQAMEFAGEED